MAKDMIADVVTGFLNGRARYDPIAGRLAWLLLFCWAAQGKTQSHAPSHQSAGVGGATQGKTLSRAPADASLSASDAVDRAAG